MQMFKMKCVIYVTLAPPSETTKAIVLKQVSLKTPPNCNWPVKQIAPPQPMSLVQCKLTDDWLIYK